MLECSFGVGDRFVRVNNVGCPSVDFGDPALNLGRVR